MRLRDQLRPELKKLLAQKPDAEHCLTATSDVGRLDCKLLAVDSIGSALQRLTFAPHEPFEASAPQLHQLGTALAGRLTYLLEPIRLLECDPDAGAALLRSTPPHRDDDTASYYELSLTRSGIVLQRYQKQSGSERRLAAINVTHEALCRCAEDLETAIREATPRRKR